MAEEIENMASRDSNEIIQATDRLNEDLKSENGLSEAMDLDLNDSISKMKPKDAELNGEDKADSDGEVDGLDDGNEFDDLMYSSDELDAMLDEGLLISESYDSDLSWFRIFGYVMHKLCRLKSFPWLIHGLFYFYRTS